MQFIEPAFGIIGGSAIVAEIQAYLARDLRP